MVIPAGPLPKMATGKLSKSMLSKFFEIINRHYLDTKINFYFFLIYLPWNEKKTNQILLKKKPEMIKKYF